MFEIEYQKNGMSCDTGNDDRNETRSIRAYLDKLRDDEFILLIPIIAAGSEDKEAGYGKK